MIVFGPVPSRRLGRSLGVNHIPPKTCTYTCAYCQLGRTPYMPVERETFYDPERIVREVQIKIEQAREAGEAVDYVTFVPDGEPTLDLNLGREIALLKPLGVPIAVISNASLIWREDVRAELAQADWVSLKVDAVREAEWRRVDRPRGSLALSPILDGIRAFARIYRGTLVTETMLVRGINDAPEVVAALADFLGEVHPATAYLSIPIRPPAEPWVSPPSEETITRVYQQVQSCVSHVETLLGYEGNAFAATGDAAQDLLSITAVHPMRRDAVEAFLARTGADWAVVRRLIDQDALIETAYQEHIFYTRRLVRNALGADEQDT